MSESSGDGGMSPGHPVLRILDGGMRPGGGTGVPVPVDGALEDPTEPLPTDGPTDDLGKLNLVTGAVWRPAQWDPTLRAMPILAAFGRTDWQTVKVPAPDNDPKALGPEVVLLLDRVRQRDGRMAEIMGQATDPSRYWAQLFSMTPESHPATWTLLAAAMATAHMVGMHWKSVYNRPRPSQVYPALLPAITLPPHPSYPSGHSLHARLIELTLGAACPPMATVCAKLAYRLEDNRHIAGVHFPSDTGASRTLANALWTSHLKPALESVIWLGEPSPLDAARREWSAGTGDAPRQTRPSPAP